MAVRLPLVIVTGQLQQLQPGDSIASGGGAGTTVVDFGAFPGAAYASVAVAAAGVTVGSLVRAWINPVASADHTADEHLVEDIKVIAGDIVAGVGFTIHAFGAGLPQGLLFGTWSVAWEWK